MFEMYYKPAKQIVKVYHVKNNKHGYAMFLIYMNNQWIYRKAKYFLPIECVQGIKLTPDGIEISFADEIEVSTNE